MNTERMDTERNVRHADVANATETTPAEAAEALTVLSSSSPADVECPGVVNNYRINTLGEEEDDKEYEIPQRYTRSGRKRAVSFPMKVRRFNRTRIHGELNRLEPQKNPQPHYFVCPGS
jgi:hypothetical protein